MNFNYQTNQPHPTSYQIAINLFSQSYVNIPTGNMITTSIHRGTCDKYNYTIQGQLNIVLYEQEKQHTLNIITQDHYINFLVIDNSFV